MMDVWNDIERLLSRFENSEAHQLELRSLIGMMPPRLDEVPVAVRKRAEEMGAEALYMAGELERVVSWVGGFPGAEASLWLGHALFDLGRYPEALPHLRRAWNELPLQEWARLKIDELILCIKLQLEPGAVTDEDFDKFHAQHRSLGVDAPIPVEIRRALAQAQKVGGLPHGVLRRAQQLFGLRPQ